MWRRAADRQAIQAQSAAISGRGDIGLPGASRVAGVGTAVSAAHTVDGREQRDQHDEKERPMHYLVYSTTGLPYAGDVQSV